uniref:Uncharacterized protein n=1 Tax=Sander lucioperca TaxID=283035 RepID=A0A8C9WZC9_SANLU
MENVKLCHSISLVTNVRMAPSLFCGCTLFQFASFFLSLYQSIGLSDTHTHTHTDAQMHRRTGTVFCPWQHSQDELTTSVWTHAHTHALALTLTLTLTLRHTHTHTHTVE